MERLNNITFILMLVFSLGCGVKGHPLPPLNPAPIGRGEPTFQEKNIKKPLKKTITPKESSIEEEE